MSSQIDIYNMALSNIGQTETVSSANEKSKAARVCSTWYNPSRQMLLSDLDWPFAAKVQALAEIGQPQSGWQFRYRYPTDCLKARKITAPSWTAELPVDDRVPFQVGNSPAGRVIHTDMEQATLLYTADVTDTEQFDALFVDALVLLLATKIAMPMSADQGRLQACWQQYRDAMERAAVHALSESQQARDPLPEFIRARG